MNIQIDRLDLVVLNSIARVSWVSGPSSRPAVPSGIWSVVSTINTHELLLAKDETLIRIPASDVRLHSKFDITHVFEKLILDTPEQITKAMKELQNGQEKR